MISTAFLKDKELWEKVISGGKRKKRTEDSGTKENPEVEANQEAGLRPKRQRLMTDYHQRVTAKKEQVQAWVEGEDLEASMEDPDPDAQNDCGGNQEVEALRTLLAEERMIQRGQKAMLRSKRKRREESLHHCEQEEQEHHIHSQDGLEDRGNTRLREGETY